MTDKTVFWEIFVEDDYDYDDYDDEYADYDEEEIAEAKKWRDDLRKFFYYPFVIENDYVTVQTTEHECIFYKGT